MNDRQHHCTPKWVLTAIGLYVPFVLVAAALSAIPSWREGAALAVGICSVGLIVIICLACARDYRHHRHDARTIAHEENDHE